MHTLEDWLPRKSALSRTRMLVAPDGERYHWKLTTGWGSNTLKLIAPESSRTIAQMRSARTGSGLLGSGKDRRLSLLVQPEATSMLDVIVLSFIILDQVRREQGLVGSTDTSLAVCPSVAAGATIVC
ncbi:hypothetical protein C8Q74DRAFT_1203628 [Fomes fomentarius]|nr:hypothetical protein C8Q74DRAFT_1203628 [Fomes fomentarius]